MNYYFGYNSGCLLILLLAALVPTNRSHEAKDFDDSIFYKIEFEPIDFDKHTDLRNNLRTFYTHEQEKYDCLIPVFEKVKEDKKSDDAAVSPLTLLRPMFSANTCSYRIEVYWSYEICHGYHIRQYHEEREGKTIKFQEYYLGKWSELKTEELSKALEAQSKINIKHKTTKIDGISYPYFEMDMTDGTICDIIGELRTTKIRYVCYPHGKNEIYSLKETSSCNYEAIILTSLLCTDPTFHPEESKEISIKCFNSDATETHKPLSMLRQELNELKVSDSDFPTTKDSNALITNPAESSERYIVVNKLTADVDKIVLELIDSVGLEHAINDVNEVADLSAAPIIDPQPIRDLLSGKTCINGGTGWWKFEFCHRVHVRQFHKDEKTNEDIFLGYFNEIAHRNWIQTNPDKSFKQQHSTSIWHHYEGGSRCDRTGRPREVDVKLTCATSASLPTSGTMYLLEPKTCQYILVVESPIICDLMKISDEYGLVDSYKLEKLVEASSKTQNSDESLSTKYDDDGKPTESSESANPINSPRLTDTVSELPPSADVQN